MTTATGTKGPTLTRIALSALLLAAGVAPLPHGWASARVARDNARSTELNRADRKRDAGGYYEGLIGGDGSPGARDELALTLMGKPANWTRFGDAGVSRQMPADYLQFELIPNVNRTLFGRRFTTNGAGLRDLPTTEAKPDGIIRVALLGSSMDMGWGVGDDQTYENLFENWLNAHAARRGLPRRFEVLNFAVAAYSPAQRLESYRRKAAAFKPDLVFYSVTMLDPRLTEIHLRSLLLNRVPLRDDFLVRALASTGLTEADFRLDARGKLVDKSSVKDKIRDQCWPIADGALGALAAECRAADIPLACLIIPRVGKSDEPGTRDEAVARHSGIAAHHAVPVIDLSASFDRHDPRELEIASWDDHPNAAGHRRLFLGLARAVAAQPELYRSLFDASPPPPRP
ncbi:SGNH/GDSL hydrolase family protein [Isosphaeraceae bacterium EP7]